MVAEEKKQRTQRKGFFRNSDPRPKAGQPFTAINAGPIFKINPSVSFFLNFDPSRDREARKRLDAVWKALSKDGSALMPLDKYPFSERYGWVQDRFGVSWRLILSGAKGDPRP